MITRIILMFQNGMSPHVKTDCRFFFFFFFVGGGGLGGGLWLRLEAMTGEVFV